MPIKTVIVEDEEKSLCVLKELIRISAADIEVLGVASHVEKAVDLIESIAPQLVLLDVRIADGLGFEVLKRLHKRDFQLICITAYDNYAVAAFRYSAIDYLLKPVGMEDWQEMLRRVRTRLAERDDVDRVGALLHRLDDPVRKKLTLSTLNGFDFVDLADIVWCNSEGGYTVFHLADRSKRVSSRNLGAYEAQLCEEGFFRIHHSCMINLRCIKSYKKGKGGYVVMCNNVELEVSQ